MKTINYTLINNTLYFQICYQDLHLHCFVSSKRYDSVSLVIYYMTLLIWTIFLRLIKNASWNARSSAKTGLGLFCFEELKDVRMKVSIYYFIGCNVSWRWIIMRELPILWYSNITKFGIIVTDFSYLRSHQFFNTRISLMVIFWKVNYLFFLQNTIIS